jgi:thiol peroxidase
LKLGVFVTPQWKIEYQSRRRNIMEERKGAVTLRGNPFTLVGTEIKTGAKAPDVQLLDNDLKPVKISDFKGQVVVVSAVPSLDTPTCDMETRRFNTEAAKLGDNVVILTVSTDLPFAQKRWCGAAGVDKVKTLSDHRETAFGQAYGVLIKELRLLARSIFVVDKNGVVQYVQHVKEVSQEPDYGAVIASVQKLV